MAQKIDLGFIEDTPKIDLGFLKAPAPPVTMPGQDVYAQRQTDRSGFQVAKDQARDLPLNIAEGLGIDPAQPLTSVVSGIWNFGKNLVNASGIIPERVPASGLDKSLGLGSTPAEAAAINAERRKATIEARRTLLAPQEEQFRQAEEYKQQGNRAGEFVHRVAGAIPLIGPQAAEIGSKIREGLDTGDVEKASAGVGNAIGMIGGLAVSTPEGEAMAAGALKKAASVPLKLGRSVATRAAEAVLGVPPAPIEATMRAIKPKATNTQFKVNLETVLPEVKASIADLGRPLSEDPNLLFQDVIDVTKNAKKKLWEQRSQFVDPALGDAVDASPVANAIVGSIPTKLWIKNPEAAAALAEEAAAYRQAHSLSDLEDMLHTTNAELDAYYDKYPTAKRNAAAKNPETAGLVAEATALRKLIYDHVDIQGQSGPAAEASRRYGQLLNFEEELYRRKNVFERQQPNSLQEQAGKLAMAKELGTAAVKIGGGLATGNPELAAVGAGLATSNLAKAWAIKKMSKFLKERGSSANMLRRALMDDGIGAPKPLSAPFTPYRPAAPVRALPAATSTSGTVIPSSGRTIQLPSSMEASNLKDFQAEFKQNVARTNPARALPPGPKPAIQLGPGDISLKDLNVTAKSDVVRDPKTGRMKRVFTSEGGEPMPAGKFNLKDWFKNKARDQRGAVSLYGITPLDQPKIPSLRKTDTAYAPKFTDEEVAAERTNYGGPERRAPEGAFSKLPREEQDSAFYEGQNRAIEDRIIDKMPLPAKLKDFAKGESKTAMLDKIAKNKSGNFVEPAALEDIKEQTGKVKLFIGGDGRMLSLHSDHPRAMTGVDPKFVEKLYGANANPDAIMQKALADHDMIRVNATKPSMGKYGVKEGEIGIQIGARPSDKAFKTLDKLFTQNPDSPVSFDLPGGVHGSGTPKEFYKAVNKAFPKADGSLGGFYQRAKASGELERGSIRFKNPDPVTKELIEKADAKPLDLEKPLGSRRMSLFVDNNGNAVDVGQDHFGALNEIGQIKSKMAEFRNDDEAMMNSLKSNKLIRINKWDPKAIGVQMFHEPTKQAMNALEKMIANNPKIEMASWEIGAHGEMGTPKELIADIHRIYPNTAASTAAGESQNIFQQFKKDTGKTSLQAFDKWIAKHSDFYEKARAKGELERGSIRLKDFGNFFTKLGDTIEEKGPNAGPAAQFLNIAKNAGKEAETTGLKSWLEALGTKKVSKADVLAKVEETMPKITDNWIGGTKGKKFSNLSAEEIEAPLEFEDWRHEAMNIDDHDWDTMSPAEQGQLAAQYDDYTRNLMDQMDSALGLSPRFEKYTLSGGTNYREYTANLPTQGRQPANILLPEGFTISDTGTSQVIKDPSGKIVYKAAARKTGDALREYDNWKRHEAGGPLGGDYEVPTGHNYGDSTLDLNRLFHARVKDREIVGGKSLFIEELQSDWHQAGRKKGYATKQPAFEDLSLEQLRDLLQKNDPNGVWTDEDRIAEFGEGSELTKPEALEQLKTWEDEDPGSISFLMNKFKPAGVPDAPFKKDWHELGMKRMLQEAVDNDYESLSWTTGKQQADRYNLSKHIDALQWDKNPDGTYGILARKNGAKVVGKDGLSESELADMVGKELAEKIITGEGAGRGSSYKSDMNAIPVEGGPKNRGVISGLGLDIGGEGMKGFYDKILPNFMDKYLKKYGVKAEKVPLHPVNDSPTLKSYHKMFAEHDDPSTWKITKDNTPGHVTFDLVDARGQKVGISGTKEWLTDYMLPKLKKYAKLSEPEPVWSIKITPEMREDLQAKGQPVQ